MKTYIAAFLIVVSLTACKGQKGDRGPAGPGTINTYTGFISSDNQIISVAAYTNSSNISVFVGDGISFTEIPYYAPTLGLNVGYYASNYVVTIFNAKVAAATNYKIIVTNAAGSSALKG